MGGALYSWSRMPWRRVSVCAHARTRADTPPVLTLCRTLWPDPAGVFLGSWLGMALARPKQRGGGVLQRNAL